VTDSYCMTFCEHFYTALLSCDCTVLRAFNFAVERADTDITITAEEKKKRKEQATFLLLPASGNHDVRLTMPAKSGRQVMDISPRIPITFNWERDSSFNRVGRVQKILSIYRYLHKVEDMGTKRKVLVVRSEQPGLGEFEV
jgi:hypothetical protein